MCDSELLLYRPIVLLVGVPLQALLLITHGDRGTGTQAVLVKIMKVYGTITSNDERFRESLCSVKLEQRLGRQAYFLSSMKVLVSLLNTG
jgi:hypothetical protein